MFDRIDPLSAPSAPNPYPYYARLRKERPWYRDDALGAWVASSSAAVEAVLGNDALRVRPPSEPVPTALHATYLGRAFALLARMTDGPHHDAARAALLVSLETIACAESDAAIARCAGRLLVDGADDTRVIDRYLFALPVGTIALLLGIRDEALHEVTEAARAFVTALVPAAPPRALTSGEHALQRLRSTFEACIEHCEPGTPLAALASRIDRTFTREAAIANAVGLLFQSHDAVAGLIGNTLCAHPADAADLDALVADVARVDAPVHNTRRYAAHDVTIAGATVRRGDTVLAVLAAANDDPARSLPYYTFGLGAHACPGTRLALRIAAQGVAHLRARIDLSTLRAASYHPAPNVRIPIFTSPIDETGSIA